MKVVFALLVVVLTNNFFAQKNIIDYYNLLPPEYTHYYDLVHKNGKWITQSIADYKIDAVVDIKNGFIEISDDGTGGGNTLLQVALFRKADHSALIGVSFFETDGFSFSSEIHFLQYSQKKWHDVTKNVLPEINYKNFYPKDYKLPDVLKDKIALIYHLPHYGTTIKVEFISNFLSIISDNTLGDTPEDERKKAYDALEKIERTEINLKWNRAEGKFHIIN